MTLEADLSINNENTKIQTPAIQKTDAVNFMQTVLNRFGDEQSRSKYVEGASYNVTSQSETEYHFENI